MTVTNDVERTIEAWAATLGVTYDPNEKPKLTQREKSAEAQHRMDTTDWVAKLAETNDQIRAQEEVRVRAQLDVEQPGHGFSDADIKAYVAKTHSDAANKRRSWEHQQVLMQQAQADHDAAQASKANTALVDDKVRLKRENAALKKTLDEAEDKVRELNRAMDDGSH